jgi:2-keto-4-pentenoate hydratase/2-oxohepta-3-ene-1,7-dioic acid hydratase in catechol pathway
MRSVDFNGQAVTPSKIICIGKNYVAHIEEMGSVIPDDMVIFLKPNASIGDTLLSAHDGETLHYEGEICLLVNDGQCAGVGFGLDLTKRASQWRLKEAGLPWERSKAFSSAALFSPFVPAPRDLNQLSVELHIDGSLRQQGGVELMLYPPSVIFEQLSRFTTLEDGDIVMTGTPAGVGQIDRDAHFIGCVRNAGETLVSAEWVAQ